MHADTKSKDKLETFEEMNSLFVIIATVLCTWFGFFISNFVGLWIGFDKQLTLAGLVPMLVILYQNISRLMFNATRDVHGWFKQTQYIAYAEGILNVVLSLILLQKLGLVGVLVATVVSNVLTNFWFYPIYTYKKLFNKKPFKYYLKFALNLGLGAVLFYATYLLIGMLNVTNYLLLICYALIYLVIILAVILGINYLVFKDFRNFMHKLKDLVKEIKNKKKTNKVQKEVGE